MWLLYYDLQSVTFLKYHKSITSCNIESMYDFRCLDRNRFAKIEELYHF